MTIKGPVNVNFASKIFYSGLLLHKSKYQKGKLHYNPQRIIIIKF